MIDAPKPDMVWKVRLGSTTTVGAVLGTSVNTTVPRSAILSVPSGVVIHTCAVSAVGGRCAAPAAWAPDRPEAVRAAAANDVVRSLMRDN